MNRFDASMLWDVADDATSSDGPDETSARGDEAPLEPTDGQSDLYDGLSSTGGSDGLDEINGDLSWRAALQAQTFFVPMHYERNYRYPLIVWLHSDGFNENQVCQLMPHISTRNYIATGVRATVAMDSVGHRFEWGDSAAAVQAAEDSVLEAIDRVAADYSVHAERIVLAGYRSGGSMAMRIAMRQPDLFAAAISLGGEIGTVDGMPNQLEQLKERRLPMLWQWSLESDHYDETRIAQQIQVAQSLRTRLEIRQYRNDDEINTAVLSDLNQWVMQHVVCGSPVGKLDRWDSHPTSFSDN